MDNNTSGGNIVIDPSQLAPQGASPVVPQPPVSSMNHLVDITPGAANVPPIAPTSSHVDDAVLPDSKVIDITPNSLSDFDKIPATPVAPITPVPQSEPVIDITPAAVPDLSSVPPVVEEPIIASVTPPMGTLPPLPVTPTDSAAPTPPVEVTAQAEEQPVAPLAPTAPVTPTAAVAPSATSPFAEDPNLVKTIG